MSGACYSCVYEPWRCDSCGERACSDHMKWTEPDDGQVLCEACVEEAKARAVAEAAK